MLGAPRTETARCCANLRSIGIHVMRHSGLIGTAVALCALLPSAARSQATCAGDCDGDGRVDVVEVVTLVNIALGDTMLSACPAGDVNQDGGVDIEELVAAVNNALEGCVAGPTNLSGDAVKGPVRDAEVVAFAIEPDGTIGPRSAARRRMSRAISACRSESFPVHCCWK